MKAQTNDWRFWIIVLVGYLLTSLFAWFFKNHTSMVAGEVWNWGEVTFLLQILYTIASVRIVGPSDIGVRLFFGKALGQVSSGLTFVPFFFCTLEIFSNLVQQAELPAEPQDIYRGDKEKDPDGKNIPLNKFPPIRITFGPPADPKTTDPYDQRMTAEVTPIIRYKIVDGVKFIQTIGNWRNARIQIEDAVVATLNEKFSGMTPAKALKELPGINRELEPILDTLIKSWGLDLESIRIKPFGFSHELNEAVLEVPKAQRFKVANIIKAEGEKQAAILAGKGKGAAEKSVLEGRTAGLKRMAKDLEVDGRAVLGAETARGVTDNPGQKTVIVGRGGFADLVGVATGVAESLKSQRSASTTAEPTTTGGVS